MSLSLPRAPAIAVVFVFAIVLVWSPGLAAADGAASATSASHLEALGQRDRLAAGASGAGSTRRVSPTATTASPPTRTVVTSAAGGNKDMAPVAMALLLIAGAVVGVVVGLVPAVLLAFLFGIRPPFWRRREAEAGEPQLVAVSALVPAPAPQAPPLAPGPVVVPMPPAGAGQAEPPPPPAAPGRHRALYDTEYARQLERLEALRQSIGEGVGRDAPQPASGPRTPRRNGSGPRPADPDQSTSGTPS
jgi:hypothetical protein